MTVLMITLVVGIITIVSISSKALRSVNISLDELI